MRPVNNIGLCQARAIGVRRAEIGRALELVAGDQGGIVAITARELRRILDSEGGGSRPPNCTTPLSPNFEAHTVETEDTNSA